MTQWLVDTLFATSALMALVLVVRGPFRARFGAQLAYGLWLLPALRFVTPAITHSVERALPEVGPGDGALALAATPLLSAEPTLMPATVAPDLVDQLGGWPMLLMVIWVTGAGLLAIHGLVAYRRQRFDILDAGVLIARLGRIRLVRSPVVTGPMAFGLMHPVIAVPTHFDRHFDDRERRLALDHELSHHQSGDLVANTVAFGLLCLQWFNPMAWASYAAFRFDQEAACDARVLARATPQDREAYGRAIAKAASGRAMLFAAALDRPSTLHRRLKTMIDTPKNPARRTGALLIAAVALVVLPLTATQAINYVDPPAAPTPPTSPTPPAAPVAPTPPVAPLAAIAAAPAVAAVPAVPAVPPVAARRISVRHDGNYELKDGRIVVIEGDRRREWAQLSTAEKAEVRAKLAHAKAELDRVRIDRAGLEREIEAELARADVEGEVSRELAQVRAELKANARDLARVGIDAATLERQIRAEINPAKLRAQIRASLDRDEVSRSLARAEEDIAKARVEIDQLNDAARAD